MQLLGQIWFLLLSTFQGHRIRSSGACRGGPIQSSIQKALKPPPQSLIECWLHLLC